jgi:hypothetical protein
VTELAELKADQARIWGSASWRLLIESDRPPREGVVNLSPGWRAEVERDWIEYFERHRTPDGVSVPRPYLLILGRRRAR